MNQVWEFGSISTTKYRREALFLSVIVPIYNEEESIPILCEKLFGVLDRMGKTFEIICINDGSSDASLTALRKVAAQRKELKVVSFRRNFGQTAAMMAGIDHAEGEIIVSIDADLQNDPEDIPTLLSKMEEGFDVVSGWRKDRQDAPVRRNFVSRVANKVISRISGVRLHDYGCTLKAYRHDVVKDVRLYGEMHRFIPIYASWMGARVCELPVRHHARKFGRSKYGLERIAKVILDLVVVKFLDRYLAKPIYVFGGFGLLSLILSIVSGLLMIWLKLFDGISMIQTPLPLFSAMTFLVSVQCVLMGLVAEIVVRTYFEARDRRVYSVRETINFGER
ncbi:glycosyltransferase family 2 protein [Mesorhizobium sp. BAC0120]|uniref:glycosyltransferase family 2 protein n=1 Tax=Mesorhizobium sp. BAC0120 TaxID=3090670 RepID=UPI00298C106B|nr:glycosyltransferase family 2 protein [Mesorhizobium sp. BAC0120]MDW6020953.1 glycosyltransferase family 2 protein [Mesorhizobium sp. BAC0120]